jgi:ComB9 competence protein
MSTTIKLPQGEEILSIDVGDPGHYKVRKQGKRIVALKPLSYGNDTSLIVYGKSGTVYPFYVRSEGYNSDNVPDLLVVIEDNGFTEYVVEEKPILMESDKEGLPTSTLPSSSAVSETSQDEGYVREIAFDPSTIKGFGEYRVSGSIRPRPEVIFRDDQFTYIQFENWDGEELPTAYVVYDGLDELVNTRVMGKTYVIESVNDVISLKSGNKYLCIEYTGDKTAVAVRETGR